MPWCCCRFEKGRVLRERVSAAKEAGADIVVAGTAVMLQKYGVLGEPVRLTMVYQWTPGDSLASRLGTVRVYEPATNGIFGAAGSLSAIVC